MHEASIILLSFHNVLSLVDQHELNNSLLKVAMHKEFLFLSSSQ